MRYDDDDWARRIWLNVIIRAAQDTMQTEEYGPYLEAIEWFEEAGEDFQMVCHLAGLDYRDVLDAYDAGRLTSGEIIPASAFARARASTKLKKLLASSE